MSYSPEQISHIQGLKSAAVTGIAASLDIRAKAKAAVDQADVAAAPAIHTLVEYSGNGPYRFALPDGSTKDLKFRKVKDSNPPVYTVSEWTPNDPV